jgi:hypothetical protein
VGSKLSFHTTPAVGSSPTPLGSRTTRLDFDFADGVPWSEVIATVDTVRGVGTSLDRDGVHVAVRLHDD